MTTFVTDRRTDWLTDRQTDGADYIGPAVGPVGRVQKELDKFLATVPDEPQSQGYTELCRAESNSLINMA